MGKVRQPGQQLGMTWYHLACSFAQDHQLDCETLVHASTGPLSLQVQQTVSQTIASSSAAAIKYNNSNNNNNNNKTTICKAPLYVHKLTT